MRLADLFEEKLINIQQSDIEIENGKMLPNQFPNKVHNFNCSAVKTNLLSSKDLTFLEKLTSLENCPKEVNSFFCYGTSITSLEYAPKIVNDRFDCNDTKITSLEYAPKIVNGGFLCTNTKITSLEYAPLKCNFFNCLGNNIKSLQGIGRKYLKECIEITLPPTIESNILGLCLVNILKEIGISGINGSWVTKGPLYEAIEIVKKHLQTDGDECMEELIQKGYKDYAKF